MAKRKQQQESAWDLHMQYVREALDLMDTIKKQDGRWGPKHTAMTALVQDLCTTILEMPHYLEDR